MISNLISYNLRGEKNFVLGILVLCVFGLTLWSCGGATSTTATRTTSAEKAPEAPAAEAAEEAEPVVELTDAERQRELLVQYNLGWPHYQAKEYELAIPYFWKVVELDKEDKYPGVFRQLGEAYVQLEKADSALIAYKMGSDKKPDDLHLHERLWWLYRARGDLELAITECEAILRLEPGSEDYMKELINLYVRNDQIEDAIAKYDELLVKDPNNKVLIDEKMNLIRMMGDAGSLIEQYEALHEQDPNNKEYIDILLEQYHRQGANEKVLEMANALLALDPNNIDALSKKADVLSDQLKFRERITVLNQILEIEPQSAQVLCDIADSYLNLKQYSVARSYGRRALKVDRQFGEAWIRIGEALQFHADDVVDKRGGFSKMNFDDKLVYQKAYNSYRNAANIPETRARANRKMEALRSVIPSKEDRFMHPDQDQPKDPVYKWTLQ